MLMDVESRESTLVFQSTYADKFVSKVMIKLNLYISLFSGLQLLPPNIILDRY